ncbi:MAG TPA: hypothetical protein VNL17_12815 [Verrucomicrobiae bacterium]|nr:hypothetical protein [Verrucomicrobiae bacterium]
MPDWKDIAKLSDKDAKTREAQFEAEMLALIAQGDSPAPAGSPTPSARTLPAPSIPIRDGVQISVTANGQTAHYNNLEAVPAPVRQQIMSAWTASSAGAVPPLLNTPAFRNALPSPPTPRPKTMKVAMFLNLMVPGAGQFYLGQRLAGAVYALTFLASFAAALIIFVRGYYDYLRLSTSGDILDSGNLEQVAHAFPAGIIGAFSAIGIVIYLASAIHLAVSRSRGAS